MQKNLSNNHPDAEYVEQLGGTLAVSKLCGLAASSVSEWKVRGIPRPWKLYLKLKYPKVFKTNASPAPSKDA